MKKIVTGFLTVVLALGLIVGCATGEGSNQANKDIELNVALYGYVPDVARFENAVLSAWTEIEPDVKLNFVSWKCYDDDPTEDVDVFVFDSLFLMHFIEGGYLLPIPDNKIHDKSDLLSFAIDGCTVDGTIYAVPQIVCANLLYTRKSDTELTSVNDVFTLHDIIGDRAIQTEIPKQNEGLLIDMSGGTSKVCMYLDALIDVNQEYTDYYETPDLDDISLDAIEPLRLLQAMGGKAQVNYWPEDNNAYVRADCLQEGLGRAYVGYTEAMSVMGDFAYDVDFRLFSYTRQTNIPVFYGDVVSVNSKISDEKKELALELMAIITDKDTIVTAISTDAHNPYPQYLLPARYSIYDMLSGTYPIYGELKDIASNTANRLFKIGPDVRSFIEDAKKVIPPLLDIIEEEKMDNAA